MSSLLGASIGEVDQKVIILDDFLEEITQVNSIKTHLSRINVNINTIKQ